MSKTDPGNYFEDFGLGQVIVHATPRTITAGDVALYTALYGPRFRCSRPMFSRAIVDWRPRRSIRWSPSTWCSARPFRTSA